MTIDEIKQKVIDREINCEQALESLVDIGYCPNIFYDDNGHWTVQFTGFQTVPLDTDPEDIVTSCHIEAADWKDSIYEALIWALSDDRYEVLKQIKIDKIKNLILPPEYASFVVSSLNAYWHQALDNLKREDLGIIERRHYETQRDRAKEMMNVLDSF